MTRDAKKQSVEAIEHLRSILKPGDTIYTVLRSVSRSGMSRNIDLYIIKDGEPQWISSYVGHAIGSPQSYKNWQNSQGLTVRGAGMDMGFHLVYSLGRVLFPDGFGLPMRLAAEPDGSEGTRPQSQDEAALMISKGWKARGRNGDASGWDNDGGYALEHRWL